MTNSKVLGSVMIIGIAITLSISGTLAYYSSPSLQHELKSQPTGDLEIVNGESSPWKLNSMIPGETEYGKITLDYTGSSDPKFLEIYFDVNVNNVDSADFDSDFLDRKNMDSKLIVKSMNYNQKSILEEVKKSLNSGNTLTLAELDEKTIGPKISDELKNTPPADGPRGEKRNFSMKICFDKEAGNGYQGDSVGLNVSFRVYW